MTTSSASCSIGVEDVWGPTVTASCLQGFDFTLLFEETILTIVPLGIAASWFFLRIARLLRAPAKVDASWLLTTKLTAYVALLALQIALLALWTPSHTPKTRATLATIILTIAIIFPLLLLSTLEHTRVVRPSTALTVYLGLSTLLDLARVRTLFYIPRLHTIAVISLAAYCVKTLVFVLELIEKRNLIRPQWKVDSTETTGSVYNRSLLVWVNGLFQRGFRNWLTVDQLNPLDSHIISASETTTLLAKWEQVDQEKKHALFSTVLLHFKWDILAGVFPRLCYTGFTFAQPFLIDRALDFSSQQRNTNSQNIAYGLIGAYAIVYIGIAISFAVYEHKTYRALTLFRGSLVSLIYQRTLQVSTSAIADAEAITLMSADIDRIGESMRFLHEWYASLIELGLSLWLLYIYLGVAMAASTAFIVFMLVISAPIATAAGNAQNPWLEAIEDRLAATVRALGSVKAIKVTGLTDYVLSAITELRTSEIADSRRYRILNALVNVSFYVSSQLTPVWGFGVYILLARARGTETLTEGIAFAALSVFSLQDQPTINIVDGIEQFQTLTNCFERIQEYLTAEGRMDCRSGRSRVSSSDAMLEKEKPEFTPSQSASMDGSKVAIMCNVSVWHTEDADPILRGVSLTVNARSITAIVGPVGSGKSTLLKVLLGETGKTDGEIHTSFATAAFCPQAPWITWGTIRDNIVGMSSWDEKWYQRVVQACHLSRDFEELAQGDQTATGTRGSRLSGGQQMRVSFARALYSRLPVLILDDVLTGLDRTTEQGILDAVFAAGGMLRQSGATVVMATNSVNHCRYADHIVVLNKDGSVSEQGAYESLSAPGGYIQRFASAPSVQTSRVQLELSDETLQELQLPEADISAEHDESRRTGDLKVYAYYTKIAGRRYMLVYGLLCVAFLFGLNFSSVWVQLWTNANARYGTENVGYWLGIYGVIAVIAILGSVCSDLLFKLKVVPKTSKKFHDLLLGSTMHATTSFLTSTDSGTITNRFSQDLQLIDNDLPEAFDQTVYYILSTLAAAVLVFIGSGYVAAAIPGCILVLYLIQAYYLRTSRQLRLLDIEAKAPLFSHFLETLGGLACIRAYGWTDFYLERNIELLNRSQKPYYLLWCIQRWLTLVLDLFVAGVAILLVAISTNVQSGNSDFLGTSLYNVVNFSMTLQLLVAEWTQLETAIGAVNRIRSYVNQTVCEDLPGESGELSKDWPSEGNISFKNVYASYSNTSDYVLKDINLEVRAGQKVAICGRTGSGKTSMSLCILRMLEIMQGSIIIDGVDISTVRREDVRTRLNAIPQEAFFLPGTLRENIDPLENAEDERIIAVLTKLGLWESLQANGGLHEDLNEDALSHGQRHLLCLARAILRPGQIVILDEVASSVDTETEDLMQGVLREEFADRTVLAIAHRLDAVLDFDQLILWDNGRIVETGKPMVLLKTEGSKFKSMYEASATFR